ncbi:MAG: Phosphomannomutase [Candidatus Moranbacteria bacterium GW2011_GWE1_36_7]|nr:MAG: Phosphomannomutase [Candidatus Moranbacteria bacterium GW2011_GWD2_36_12]KKQ04545.1 MAG: Phosphomannomutase [Candidatus Moranbacteria bacterium GW2011_GWE2_36_40]KKQ11696.1 MAG: Phosphomannomutase [Candidatus Moranbacteria bacterium GW2011_GWE1_36_7]
MKPEIFKAYDIRGLYPQELSGEDAYQIGRAIVEHTKAKSIVVGADMRTSSPEIQTGLMRGITEQGANVINIGLVSTPMLYFASWKLDVDGGVMITASHNTAEWNGLKLCKKNAVPIGEGDGMEEIRDLALGGKFTQSEVVGTIENDETLKKEYFEYISGFFKSGFNRKKIVIDFANSVGALDKEIFEKFSNDIEPVYLFEELDGTFPNHEANPLKLETLKSLQEKVLTEKADLGISYDGDADRVGFVDEKGEIVPMDYMIALLAEEILKKYPGGTVLMDLRSSNAVKEVIEEAGGKVHRCRVGHSLIKGQMRRDGAIFAGELSGHYFFEENSKAEMTTLAVITLLNLLNETGKTMSQLTENLKRYSHSGEINSDVEDKAGMMNKLKELYKEGTLDELDGVRIDFPDWWFNVRASNTEPKLRLNLEAKTKELMEQKRDELLNIIRS